MREALDQLDLTELLFERLPAGVAIFDAELRLQRCNPTWASFISRYTPTPAAAVTPGRTFYELAPGTRDTFAPIFARVLAGETLRFPQLEAQSGGITSYWNAVLSPLLVEGVVVGIVDIVTDVTEQRASHQKLERRVRERTQQLATLLDVSHTVASTLELEPLLDNILDQLKKVLDYTGATFLQLEGEDLVVLAHRGPAPLPLPFTDTASRNAVLEGQTVLIPDLNAHLAPGEQNSYVHSWIAVPLLVKERVIGLLSLDHSEPNHYNEYHAQLAQTFANQVAVYIENAQLYAETRQRADEIQTLFSVQQAIIGRLDPDIVLQMIADEARRLTNTEMSAVYLCEGDDFVISVVSGDVSEKLLGYRFPAAGSVAGVAVKTASSQLVADTEKHPLINSRLVERVGARAFIAVPLISGGKPFGTIIVANHQPGKLRREDERVLALLASGAAIALENARLFVNLEQRTQELEALYRADEELYRYLELDDVLNALVKVTVEILAADKSSVMVWDEAGERLVVRAHHGFSPETVAEMSFTLDEGAIGIAAEGGELVIVEDTTQEPNVARRITEAERIRSFMHVPLRISGRIFGVFNVSYVEPHAFGEDEQRLFMALAQRAALVIENARLYERAQTAAAAEERNRLARELHDAVTQTLFSASLIADVLPRIWERDEAQGQARLQELRELTRGALAEMRALLLELRPATLTEISLGDLLRQLAEALIGRSRLPIRLDVSYDPDLPADVQVALYRIAQESLNNTIKHASAGEAGITLAAAGAGGVLLRIEDNGRGFDMKRVRHNSLGLSIMQERAQRIGATLVVDSSPETGTTVSARWQPPAAGQAPRTGGEKVK